AMVIGTPPAMASPRRPACRRGCRASCAYDASPGSMAGALPGRLAACRAELSKVLPGFRRCVAENPAHHHESDLHAEVAGIVRHQIGAPQIRTVQQPIRSGEIPNGSNASDRLDGLRNVVRVEVMF